MAQSIPITFILTRLSAAMLIGCIVALSACSKNPEPNEESTQLTVSATNATPTPAADCTAMDSWFPHVNTPRPDDSAFQSTSNCVFHQWSWQMFLWLTQDVDGQPRFMGLDAPQNLLKMSQRGGAMFPRMSKSQTPESFDEYLQAGTDGIMVAHNGRAIYYSQYINPTFSDFIKSNDLTDPAKVLAMDPNTTFPIMGTAGAMELKASWMIVTDPDEVDGMFTTKSEVAKLVNRGGKIVIDPSQVEEVTLALVGFHIGGIVNGHPEMIWATFEQVNNAPNIPPGAPLEEAASDQNFTFYDAGTIIGKCNINPASSNKLVLNEETQNLQPITQVCRQYEFGNAPGDNTQNDGNIAELNKDVGSKLASTDVWRNYREVGAIWFNTIDGLKPGLDLATDELLTGSLKLSNSTIETFTQRASVMENCFRCHNTEQEIAPSTTLSSLPATNLNISHAFQNIFFWSQETAK